MERWIINPETAPAIIRRCSKCGMVSKFICSGNFRINANGKNIDVWLIYKCHECDTTWKMEIISRLKPDEIEKSLWRSFAENKWDIAMKYAFDPNILNKNKTVVSYDEVVYTVEKQSTTDTDYELEIISSYDFGLRLDKLLSDELRLSRTKVKILLANITLFLIILNYQRKQKSEEFLELRS